MLLSRQAAASLVFAAQSLLAALSALSTRMSKVVSTCADEVDIGERECTCLCRQMAWHLRMQQVAASMLFMKGVTTPIHLHISISPNSRRHESRSLLWRVYLPIDLLARIPA